MKFSNFRDYKFYPKWRGAIYAGTHKATVDVTTRAFPWFKEVTTTVDVYTEGMYWRFADTGEYTPQLVIEKMFSSYKAKQL